MSEIKLLPCPLCETEAYTHIRSVVDDVMKGYIQCNNADCALKMEFEIKAERVLLSFEDVINGLHNVSDKWNRRAGEQNEQS